MNLTSGTEDFFGFPKSLRQGIKYLPHSFKQANKQANKQTIKTKTATKPANVILKQNVTVRVYIFIKVFSQN